ncbi:MAG: Na+/H+ antiporter [Ferruginibacter sp.]|nr:Na+/H+ antiporter [Ferruginibacter sp.]
MILDNIFLILTLLFAVSMLAMLSQKLRISYPIFLVLAGLVIGFIPGMPAVSLNPDIVFLIFLPPLLYSAAWNTSWKDFWQMRRPISLLSIGLVIFTSTAVAFLAHAMIPGFSLALGFLLGGIISPPDAVAATSVLQGLKVPKRVVTILEGESLINDASSLIVFRFALAVMMTGQFSFVNASTQFLLVAGLGLLIGLAIAHVVYAVHRFLPTTPNIDTALTLISPYLMYLVAEHFHYSGVMAVVSGGLFLSYRSHEVFNYSTRIQAYSVWEVLVFLLNGLVFILIGLQLPQIIHSLGGYSVGDAILFGLIISVTTVVIRIIWVFPGAYIPRILFPSIRKTERRPGWKPVFLVAWSGMRGVVSLASALAVPLTLTNGELFPQRNLILFITFIVILFTLVFQGLSLPWLIRKLDIQEPDNNEGEQLVAIKLRLAEAALKHLERNYVTELESIQAYERIKDRYKRMVDNSHKKLLHEDGDRVAEDFLPRYRQMLLELVEVRRKVLYGLYCEKIYSDELIRNKEWELDLEEARLNE